MKRFDKLTIQTVALLMTFIATLPVYAGLQHGNDPLAWFGIAVAALGMALGMWVS